MPAVLTRPCAVCTNERATPSEFRDLDELDGPGRPPRTCRECRKADPNLAAAHERVKLRRAADVALRESRSARTPAQIIRDRDAAHPSGLKTCPPVSGCGQPLLFQEFGLNKTMLDGLAGLCLPCQTAYAALQALKG